MSLGDVTKKISGGELVKELAKELEFAKEIARIVTDFAAAEAALSAAKKAREGVRDRAISLFDVHGIQEFVGPEGSVQVTVAMGSRRLDTKKVRRLLSRGQIEECTTVGKPQTKVKFVAAKEV